MATVGGVSSSTTTNSFYNNKISGLASGLDTETLIENMTAATRSKIAKQKQKKQTVQWKMDAMRSISNLLVSFRNKYASFTSPSTNLLNSDFFSRNLINTIGENSKYIKATGASNSADSLSILGVKNLASSASMNIASASDKLMESGDLDLSDGAESTISAIAGGTIRVKYADKITSISFASSGEFNTMQDVADAINEQFDSSKINVEASVENGNLVFKGDKGYEGSTFEILGGTGGALEALGIKAESKLSGSGSTIKGTGTDANLKKTVKTWDAIGGKSMTFSYNGVTKQIKLATKEEIDQYKKDNNIDPKDTTDPRNDNFDIFQKLTQEKLDKAFGKDRITVGKEAVKNEDGTTKANSGKLTFATEDKTSILKVTTGDTGLLGKSGVLGINYGESNRINTNIALKDSGLFGAANLQPASVPKLDADGNQVKDKDGNPVNENVYKISINGVDFEFKEDEKISNIISTINKSDAGVTMSYNETSDSFSIKASDSGASGQIDIQDVNGNLAEVMFGTQVKDGNGNIVSYNRTVTDANGNPPTNANGDSVASSKFKAGEDATISVDFGDGAGPMEIKRSSNVFDIDGMSITVTGTFGTYGSDGHIDEVASKAEAVTFDAQVDSDKAVDAVKQMVDDYNALIELVNKELTTKRDRDYAPLTDEQKADMSENEIKLWEEKAKAGMLFNDSDLRGLSSELRTIFSSTDMKALEDAGISISSDYSENGKITFNEDKFRAAVEADPDGIAALFTSEKDAGADFDGIMTSMEALCKKYASTTGATKGILIERAGNTASPLSLTNNAFFKEMEEIQTLIDTLNDKLKSERTRYNNQFTNLEVLMSQMNSQSSYLSQLTGGY